MGYEVDFLPVTAGGAAISVRWGVPGDYKILVFDGGTAISGERLVAHIERLYMSSRVDYLVSSHPAPDHVAGLAVVMRKLRVGELWMHRPWLYSSALRRTLGTAYALEREALSQGIPVHQPFAGASIGAFTVLSPHRDWYADALVPDFDHGPGRAGHRSEAGQLAALLGTPGRLMLPSGPDAARNESSAVLYADFDGRGVLLSGRAGVRGLGAAADRAERFEMQLPSRLRLLQLPDRGNAGNLSTFVLDRIVGLPLRRSLSQYTKSAFISVGLDGNDEPNRTVTDALARRGMASFSTRGMSLHHAFEMPDRGWYQARPSALAT